MQIPNPNSTPPSQKISAPPPASPPSSSSPPTQTEPKLLQRVSLAISTRHYSPKTEEAYLHWIKQFIYYHQKKHPKEMGEIHINEFLTHLATEKKVSASTQNQALAALLFLYKNVLDIALNPIESFIRAKKPKRLPTVLSTEEIRILLNQLSGDKWIIASLLYGSGMRLMECLQLRIQDFDFARNTLIIHHGKGGKDRFATLPRSVQAPLKKHLEKVQEIHTQDLAAGWGKTLLPHSISNKNTTLATHWPWKWAFPQTHRWSNTETKAQGRHHLDPSLIQKAIKEASTLAGISKRVSCHTLRHSYAAHLLESGVDIRTIQQLLGHQDIKTTMIYIHAQTQGPLGIQSPMDALLGGSA
jgi:integron integrase